MLLDSAAYGRAVSQTGFRVSINFVADLRRSYSLFLQNAGNQVEYIVPSLENLLIHFVQRLHFRDAEIIVIDVQEAAKDVKNSHS